MLGFGGVGGAGESSSSSNGGGGLGLFEEEELAWKKQEEEREAEIRKAAGEQELAVGFLMKVMERFGQSDRVANRAQTLLTAVLD